MLKDPFRFSAKLLCFICDLNSLILNPSMTIELAQLSFNSFCSVLIECVKFGVFSEDDYTEILDLLYDPYKESCFILTSFKVLKNGDRQFSYRTMRKSGEENGIE